MPPLLEAPVIEKLQFLGDDVWNNAVCEAFLEHHQTAHTTVTILKGMDCLELLMQIDDVLQTLFLLVIVGRK